MSMASISFDNGTGDIFTKMQLLPVIMLVGAVMAIIVSGEPSTCEGVENYQLDIAGWTYQSSSLSFIELVLWCCNGQIR
jgi:hypothetical protein